MTNILHGGLPLCSILHCAVWNNSDLLASLRLGSLAPLAFCPDCRVPIWMWKFKTRRPAQVSSLCLNLISKIWSSILEITYKSFQKHVTILARFFIILFLFFHPVNINVKINMIYHLKCHWCKYTKGPWYIPYISRISDLALAHFLHIWLWCSIYICDAPVHLSICYFLPSISGNYRIVDVAGTRRGKPHW